MGIVIRLERDNNYYMVPKNIFHDFQLSYKGRGILGTMLSLPEGWDYSVEGLVTLSAKDGKASVMAGLKELEELGYLRRQYIRDEKGRVIDIEYIISEAPIAATLMPVLEQYLAEENPFVRAAIQKQLFMESMGAVPTPAPQAAAKRKKKPPKAKAASVPESIAAPVAPVQAAVQEVLPEPTQEEPLPEPQRTPQQIETMVRSQVDYVRLITKFNDRAGRAVVDNIVQIITDVLCRDVSKSQDMIIGGAQYSTYHVQQRLQSVQYNHVEEIMFQIACNAKEIRNPYGYLLSMLFNAPASYAMKSMLDTCWLENMQYKPSGVITQ